MPDVRALAELVALWRRWRDKRLARGETPWNGVFELLRDLRPWGPQDRVQPLDRDVLEEELVGRTDEERVFLEIELIYRGGPGQAAESEDEVRATVVALGGAVVTRSRIADIAYHAVLAELPVPVVREVIARSGDGLAGLDAIMHIRPQSIASTLEIADPGEAGPPAFREDLREPILALIDGMPVAAHPLLSRHLVVDDPDDLAATTPVAERIHGTAMASLIVHGDRNRPAPALPRRIYVAPVLGAGDNFPPRRLIIDLIYLAVVRMREGAQAAAPGVLIVNISLGNSRRRFQGALSPWARLLDRLAYRFGLLFVVSAGNVLEELGLPSFANSVVFEDAAAAERASGTLSALGIVAADRRLFSPSETLNGVTVGACNDDGVSEADRRLGRVNVDPYPQWRAANPSSALGPGFALSVKPDILMPGGGSICGCLGPTNIFSCGRHLPVVPPG